MDIQVFKKVFHQDMCFSTVSMALRDLYETKKDNGFSKKNQKFVYIVAKIIIEAIKNGKNFSLLQKHQNDTCMSEEIPKKNFNLKF